MLYLKGSFISFLGFKHWFFWGNDFHNFWFTYKNIHFCLYKQNCFLKNTSSVLVPTETNEKAIDKDDCDVENFALVLFSAISISEGCLWNQGRLCCWLHRNVVKMLALATHDESGKWHYHHFEKTSWTLQILLYIMLKIFILSIFHLVIGVPLYSILFLKCHNFPYRQLFVLVFIQISKQYNQWACTRFS